MTGNLGFPTLPKDLLNIDIYRGIIEKFSLVWDRWEAQYPPPTSTPNIVDQILRR